ncbi:MAG: polysaccharide deacetylase family protein [Faecalimonas sp.]|nr:polysaccharide deacetylase family protein [Faecalimonas sp.]
MAEQVTAEPPPKIALTFDDGPSVHTERLLQGLEERGVKATFFVIGKYAEKYPELVKREYEDGHLLGNHTYSHVQITRLGEEEARAEIIKTNQILEELTGKRVEYVRPPFGVWKEKLQDLEMTPVLWTVDPLDWTTKNADEIVNKVVTKAEENAIILLHDCYKSSVDAALRIVDILQSRGYEFVTVEELWMN